MSKDTKQPFSTYSSLIAIQIRRQWRKSLEPDEAQLEIMQILLEDFPSLRKKRSNT
jgi:hypothetical protein